MTDVDIKRKNATYIFFSGYCFFIMAGFSLVSFFLTLSAERAIATAGFIVVGIAVMLWKRKLADIPQTSRWLAGTLCVVGVLGVIAFFIRIAELTRDHAAVCSYFITLGITGCIMQGIQKKKAKEANNERT